MPDPHRDLPVVPLSRRAVLGLSLAGLAGCAAPRAATWHEVAATPSAIPSPAAPSISAAAGPNTKIKTALTRFARPQPTHPAYAGAVALVVKDGISELTAVGDALRYRAGPVELPVAQRVRMRPDAIFDLASLTKVYTTLLLLQLVDAGRVELDAPVRRYLPEFTAAGVTVAMLLAHTGALPVGPKRSTWPSIYSTALVGKPGTTFRYSSVGLLLAGRIVEKLTGRTLDAALKETITGPLGLKDTGFRPLRWVKDKQRLVATDARTNRGLLRGTVHDDVCNNLGGVAGSAGIFATAEDVAVIGRLLLNGGTHDGHRILSPTMVEKMLTNANPGRPAIDPEHPGRTAEHGLGVELNQPWFMGRLSSPTTFGHTGFTGTSIVVAPERDLVLVVLTNRAHPNWSWADPDPVRVAIADACA